MSLDEPLPITPIINASGSVTRLGGAPMPAAVVQAYVDAARSSVPLDQMQAAASRVIRDITGAEAGLITSGSAAALLLGTAAILTRSDLARMERLPDCSGFAHDFLIAREQRNGYDHAVRAAGARLVEVGFHEPIAGAGVRRCEAWEYEAAISSETAAIVYVHTADSHPPLAEVIEIAHARGLPVIVDAAGELPPRANLRNFIVAGADLVCFSGGKAIRGPQATGILCGRREFVGAAAVQMLDMDDHPRLWEPPEELIDRSQLRGMPRHGIGRALKVSKEQIASCLTALKLFASGAYERELPAMQQRLERLAADLRDRGIASQLVESDGESYPLLEVVVPTQIGRSPFEVTRRLRHHQPPIFVGHGMLESGRLVIHPLHLSDQDCEIISLALRNELGEK